MTSGIDMQYPVDGDDYTYRPIEYVTLRRADLHALHGDMAALESALEAVQADDAALRQRLAEVEAEREELRRVLSELNEPMRRLGYGLEVQPCPKCKGTGYRYNIYGEMAECMDCGARGEAQP